MVSNIIMYIIHMRDVSVYLLVSSFIIVNHEFTMNFSHISVNHSMLLANYCKIIFSLSL